MANRSHVAAVILDENNLAEMARHGVNAREVEQALFNRRIMAPNPHGEPGSMLLIGETDGGRTLTIPLAPTGDPGTWRPATAFDATRRQTTLFRRYAR